MDPGYKLVTYSALAIVADEGTGPLQELRVKHDPAYERWPPHINIYFPFVDPDSFDEVYESLRAAFAEFEEFEITFT